jgi:hypothetical protein
VPLAISSALRFSLRRTRWTQLSDQPEPFLEFRSPSEKPQRTLANPPRRASSSRGLSFPTAREGSEVRFTRASRARHLPRPGFGYPLRGLLPPSPCRFSLAPTALLGFTLRSLLLPRGIHAFPHGCTHVPFLPPLLPSPERRAGPAGRGSWVLTLARIPGGLTRG